MMWDDAALVKLYTAQRVVVCLIALLERTQADSVSASDLFPNNPDNPTLTQFS